MWFDLIVLVVLISGVGMEVAKGGRAISPTKFSYLIIAGLLAVFLPQLASKVGLPVPAQNTVAYLLIVFVALNIFFIIPAIVATSIIQAVVSAFLLAFLLQFVPQWIPANSKIYPLFAPFAHKAYLFVNPYLKQFADYVKSRIPDLKNIDVSKVKPTLAPGGSGGELKPTLP